MSNPIENDEQLKKKYLLKNIKTQIKITLIFTPIITSGILIGMGLLKKNKWKYFLNVNNKISRKVFLGSFLGLSLCSAMNTTFFYLNVNSSKSTKELKKRYISIYNDKA